MKKYIIGFSVAVVLLCCTAGYLPRINSLIQTLGTPVERGINKELWLASRSDDKPGTGTAEDPYNCGGSGSPSNAAKAAKLDTMLKSLSADGSNITYMTIHFLPGTFYTTGSKSYNTNGYFLNKGWKLIGAGKDKTIIIKTGVPPGWSAGVVARHTVFESDSINNLGDDIEIRGMTVDANWGAATNGGWINKASDAITLTGSRITVADVHIRNTFGNADPLVNLEDFGIGIGPSTIAGVVQPITDVVIDECSADNFQGDYGGPYTISSTTGVGGAPAYWSNLVIRNSVAMNWQSSGSVFGAPTVEGCKSYNCKAPFRLDTVNSDNDTWIIRNCEFRGNKGNGIEFIPNLTAHNAHNITVTNNLIELDNAVSGVAIALSTGSSTYNVNATIADNLILKKDTGGGQTLTAIVADGVQGLKITGNTVGTGITDATFYSSFRSTTGLRKKQNRRDTGALLPNLSDTSDVANVIVKYSGHQSITIASNAVMAFDTIFSDGGLGSSYNTTNKTFTAPTTGLYRFTLQFTGDSRGWTPALRVGGTDKIYFRSGASEGATANFGSPRVISLTANDVADLKIYNDVGATGFVYQSTDSTVLLIEQLP